MFVSLIFLIFQIRISSAEDQCFNAAEMTVPQLGLSYSQFWTAKSQDLEQCAKLCVRRKQCLSITYNTQSRMCELNAGTRENTTTRIGSTLLYSEFERWPSSLDKNCFSRPCQDSESCISGGLTNDPATCSYSCLTVVREVCPMPALGVSNGRTVGSVNAYTCSKGTVGGGNATCLPSKQWDKELQECTPIYNYPCSDDTLCSLIKGTCSEQGKCVCGPYKTYVENEKECIIDCGDPTEVDNADVSGNISTQFYQCDANYYPTSSSEAKVTCTETGWEPENSFACYKCEAPPSVDGVNVPADGQVRQYICGNDMYPLPGTGDGTITCDEDTSSWKPAGFQCGGLRLVPGPLQEMTAIPNSGYLEMFAGGVWRAITHEKWTWQATQVACRKLGFNFGGTYHKDWFDEDATTGLSEVSKLNKHACTGDEETLELCPEFELKNGNDDKLLAITCFDNDISGSVTLSNVNTGTVLVNILGAKGGVCSSGWNDKATTVACKTINNLWTGRSECKDNCAVSISGPLHTNHIHCEGDESHLMFCENRGWGYSSDCDNSNLVTIDCDTGGDS